VAVKLIIGTQMKRTQQKKFYIYKEHLTDCQGMFIQKCMLIKNEIGDEWEYFYDFIKGFNYKEGFRYKINVKIIDIVGSAKDSPSMKYQLINIIEKINLR